MDTNTNEFLKIVLPGIIAIIGNIIFYLIIKGRIDKSIEKHKISYSGIFKEKVEIYRAILQRTYDLKWKIKHYLYTEDHVAVAEDIRKEIEDFNRYFYVNKPFLSDAVIDNTTRLKEELEHCFQDSNKVTLIMNKSANAQEADRIVENLFKVIRKLIGKAPDNPFVILEKSILLEVRRDLQVDAY